MPTRIELLKQAGFSDPEIGDWATAERQRMQDAGFSDNEIDAEFGVTRPPKEVPAAYIERLKQNNALQRIAGAAGEYARQYFGDEPLGLSPRDQDFLHRLGAAGDIIIPVAKPADAVMRAVPAGLAAVGAGVGQAVEEAEDAAFGAGPEAKGKAARDFAQLAQFAALVAGANRTAAAPVRAPAPRIAAASEIAVPRAEDFRNAAAVISGTPSSFGTEQKLLRLWTEHGIPPAEAAEDAARDRVIAADLASDADTLPAPYAGHGVETNGATAAAAAGKTNAPAPSIPRTEPGQAGSDVEEAPGAAAEQAPADGTGVPAPMEAESRDISMFNPPLIEPRPFKFDYRAPPQASEDGRLLYDAEGRLLRAVYVAGRRFAGGADQPISPNDVRMALPGLDIRLIESPDQLADSDSVVGLYSGETTSKGPRGDLFVRTTTSPEDQKLILMHEFSHAIDHYAGITSKRLTPAEVDELRRVYTTMRAGPRRTLRPQPEDFGYKKRAVKRELMAEGLRAYLADPNYFKAVAPRTAARIRDAVNTSPYLKRVIQFNSLAAAALIGAGAGGNDGQDQDGP